jgi:hypothetical protein
VYCPSGASLPINVSAGYYSVGTVGQRSDQQQCAPGSYCVGGVAIPCPAGLFGASSGLSSPGCSGNCSAGHACPMGSTNAAGMPCPPGRFSLSGWGACADCGPGRYGASSGASTAACTGPCTAGYFCAPGSTNATAQECPRGAYCPEGGAAPIPCPVGRYGSSTLGTAFRDCTICPGGTYGNRSGEADEAGCAPCPPLEGSGPGAAACWPGVVSATADDLEPLSTGLSEGDTVTITFTKATDGAPVGSAIELAALLSFSSPLFTGATDQSPTRLTGCWAGNGTQLVVTVVNPSGVSLANTDVGRLNVSVWGVRDLSQMSFPLPPTNVVVGGTWGVPTPVRFLAGGRGFEVVNTGGQAGPGAGDSLILRFNQEVRTSTVPIATKADIDAVFAFSQPIGLNYTGVWESVHLGVGGFDYQARITVLTPTSNATTEGYRYATRVGGSLSVTLQPSAGLRDVLGQAAAASDTTTLTLGSWGDGQFSGGGAGVCRNVFLHCFFVPGGLGCACPSCTLVPCPVTRPMIPSLPLHPHSP